MLDDSFRIRYKEVPVAISEQHSFYPTKLHNHSEFEILYITSGSCTACVAGREYHLESGDLIFINPVEVHSVSVNSGTPYSHKCMCFDLSIIMNNRICENLKGECTSVVHLIKGDTPHGEYLGELFEKAFSEIKNEGKTFAMETTAYITLMFSYLLKNSLIDEKRESPRESSFCSDVLTYINSHYNEITSSKQVAEACFLNHSYFCRKFKENFGINFSAYLNRYRISIARTMLEENAGNIFEISQRCGFETPAYFSKCFKKYVGILPVQYKKGKSSL